MNPSIVDYLNSTGQKSDYASRAQLAASKGIGGYAGTAQQNTQLLNLLRGGATGAPIAQPTATPTSAPVSAPQPSSQSRPAGGDTELQQLAKTDRNPVQETRYQELLKQEQQAGGGSGLPAFNQPTINLPQIYESLYKSSGITDVEKDLAAKTDAYNAQRAKISDNPYLSEGEMTGRLSKLQDKFNADVSNVQNQIATKKADIETQLNLQTKQFDINSQQVQQAWNQFNSLLSAGALDNASGEDIANLTRSTGISSSMIYSAIDQNKKKNAPQVSISQLDDGTNVYAIAVDDQGNVVNRQVIGSSKPAKTTSSGTGDKLTPTQNRAAIASATKALSTVDENEDKKVSLAEYKKALQLVIEAQGVSDSQADDYLTTQMQTLGYSKWRW